MFLYVFVGLAVAFRDEDRAGPGQMRGRLAQGAAREQPLVAEGLLAVHQHDVLAAAAQFPVLKSIIKQERIAAKLFDRIAATFDAVLVHKDDDIFQVGSEHVGLVAGHFRIEQQ